MNEIELIEAMRQKYRAIALLEKEAERLDAEREALEQRCNDAWARKHEASGEMHHLRKRLFAVIKTGEDPGPLQVGPEEVAA